MIDIQKEHMAYLKRINQTAFEIDALVKACKVGLLDRNNREYMKNCDPMWFEQMVAAVKPWEPDIEEQIRITYES
jgi:hypothetical protein